MGACPTCLLDHPAATSKRASRHARPWRSKRTTALAVPAPARPARAIRRHHESPRPRSNGARSCPPQFLEASPLGLACFTPGRPIASEPHSPSRSLSSLGSIPARRRRSPQSSRPHPTLRELPYFVRLRPAALTHAALPPPSPPTPPCLHLHLRRPASISTHRAVPPSRPAVPDSTSTRRACLVGSCPAAHVSSISTTPRTPRRLGSSRRACLLNLGTRCVSTSPAWHPRDRR